MLRTLPSANHNPSDFDFNLSYGYFPIQCGSYLTVQEPTPHQALQISLLLLFLKPAQDNSRLNQTEKGQGQGEKKEAKVRRPFTMVALLASLCDQMVPTLNLCPHSRSEPRGLVRLPITDGKHHFSITRDCLAMLASSLCKKQLYFYYENWKTETQC